MMKTEMQREHILHTLQIALAAQEYPGLQKFLAQIHVADAAAFIESLPPKEAALVFRLLPKTEGAQVFAELEFDAQQELLHAFTDRELQEVVEELYLDDAVDLLEELPAGVVARVLRLSDADRRAELNHYLRFPKDSAGSIMTGEFMMLKKHWTVGQAIKRIRENGQDKETIYTCYVTDAFRVLEGVVSVRTLLLSPDTAYVGECMDTHIIQAQTHDDQEVIVPLFREYDLLSLPIVDTEKRMVGIITVDDALDVSDYEVTEDFQRMALTEPSARPYLKTPVHVHAKNRVSWLLILMLSGMVNGRILEGYEHAFLAIPVLVSFIPMLTDTGGNAGSQSSTIIIRGMSMGEIVPGDIGRIIWSELRIALLVGLVMAAVNYARIYFFVQDGDPMIALTVSLALLFVILLSKVVGGTLPILAKKAGVDPAIMAAPLITTVVDALGLILYFSIAVRLLQI